MTDFERLREMLEPKLGGWLSAAQIDDLVRYQLKQGVLVPPCKVGDQIFIGSGEFKDARMAEIIKIIFSLEKNEILYRPTDFHGMKLKSSFGEFGKNIFSTREAAEQALKERKNEIQIATKNGIFNA